MVSDLSKVSEPGRNRERTSNPGFPEPKLLTTPASWPGWEYQSPQDPRTHLAHCTDRKAEARGLWRSPSLLVTELSFRPTALGRGWAGLGLTLHEGGIAKEKG